MANLAAYQKISRVISTRDFGDGVDGSATISASNTCATFSGTATQSTGTSGSSSFANGDLVFLIQYQGTGRGQYEWNMVSSGGGSTSLTFQTALQYTYGTGAQIVKIPRYTTATIGSHSITAWNGSTGGIEIIVAKTSITGSSALTGTGLGFRAGARNTSNGATQGGEGGNGYADTTYGAAGSVSGCGGPGGGYGTTGSAAGSGGTPGSAYGSADLTVITAGGSGSGASGSGDASAEGNGGASGGILILISPSINLTSGVNSNGNKGDNGTDRGGGGGSGGSVLLICNTASIGTNNITATAGAAGSGVDSNANGGAGGNGRIAIHHSSTITGTSNPTFTDVTDTSLLNIDPSGQSGRFYFM